jgi:hypothetical protein
MGNVENNWATFTFQDGAGKECSMPMSGLLRQSGEGGRKWLRVYALKHFNAQARRQGPIFVALSY